MPGRASKRSGSDLHDIRTLSWGVGRIANEYVAHLQIACLEMEKVRKGREKASALQRAETLNGRLRDIEAEKASLLGALAERGAASAARGAERESNRTAPTKVEARGGSSAGIERGR